MYKFVLSACMTIPLLLMLASVDAAPADKIEKYGSWFYQCKTVNEVEACALRHVQLFKDKTPALTLAIVYSGPDDQYKMHFKAPLGVYLPDGLRFQIDSRKEFTGQYLDCQQSGCAGVISLDEDQIWALKAGKKLNVTFSYRRGNKTTQLVVPLNGTSEGLKKVRQSVKTTTKTKDRKPAAEQKAAEQKAAEQKAAEQKAAEQKAAEQKAAEQKAAEQKAAEQKAAEQKAAEQKAAEQKAAEQKAAEQKAAEQKAAEQKAAEQKAAEQKAAEQKAAEQKAAEQEKASSGIVDWLGDLFSNDKESTDGTNTQVEGNPGESE